MCACVSRQKTHVYMRIMHANCTHIGNGTRMNERVVGVLAMSTCGGLEGVRECSIALVLPLSGLGMTHDEVERPEELQRIHTCRNKEREGRRDGVTREGIATRVGSQRERARGREK